MSAAAMRVIITDLTTFGRAGRGGGGRDGGGTVPQGSLGGSDTGGIEREAPGIITAATRPLPFHRHRVPATWAGRRISRPPPLRARTGRRRSRPLHRAPPRRAGLDLILRLEPNRLLNGRCFDRDALDTMLADVERVARLSGIPAEPDTGRYVVLTGGEAVGEWLKSYRNGPARSTLTSATRAWVMPPQDDAGTPSG